MVRAPFLTHGSATKILSFLTSIIVVCIWTCYPALLSSPAPSAQSQLRCSGDAPGSLKRQENLLVRKNLSQQSFQEKRGRASDVQNLKLLHPGNRIAKVSARASDALLQLVVSTLPCTAVAGSKPLWGVYWEITPAPRMANQMEKK